MKWFRLYTEVLNDPKVQQLPAELFRSWINVMCVARENGGTVPDSEALAFKLRMKTSAAQRIVDRLIDAELIDVTETGLEPHNWRFRQFESDGSSTTRCQAYRRRIKESGAKINGYLKHKVTVFARDGGRCVYCGSSQSLCLDHMVPVILGGDDHPTNLAVACKRCNSGKAGRTPEMAGYYFVNRNTETIYRATVTRLKLIPSQTDKGDGFQCYPPYNPPYTEQNRTDTEGASVTPSRFDEFWTRYPHKVGKDQTARMWVSLVTPENEPAVFAGLERWEQSEQWSRRVYQKPANWLSEHAWEDHPAPAKQSGVDIAALEAELEGK